MAACRRSISEFISAMRSDNSSTDSSDRSCPISWVTFFLGLSSSSVAMRFSRRELCGGIFAVAWYVAQVLKDAAVIFAGAQFQARMPRPDRMELDRKG